MNIAKFLRKPILKNKPILLAYILFLIFFYRVSELSLHVFSFKSIPSINGKFFYQKLTENLFLCIFVIDNGLFEALHAWFSDRVITSIEK